MTLRRTSPFLAAAAAAVLLLALLGSSQAVTVCTITWDGELNDNNWTSFNPGASGAPDDDKTNWVENDGTPGDRLPNANDHACILTGAPRLSTTTAVGDFEIAQGATLEIDGALEVHGSGATSQNAGTLRFIGGGGTFHTDLDGSDSEGLLNTSTGTIQFPDSGMRVPKPPSTMTLSGVHWRKLRGWPRLGVTGTPTGP